MSWLCPNLDSTMPCCVQVDATEDVNKDLATKYGVQGFPTLKVMLCPAWPLLCRVSLRACGAALRDKPVEHAADTPPAGCCRYSGVGTQRPLATMRALGTLQALCPTSRRLPVLPARS